ncbi:hypothetical protein Pmani_006857 [Petrolisthes manimaculis]|uniref:Uncharacterized protein n=1 Tax=Petrolisthes manimaculis TaxID=1843537 RepID=A0AAE1UFD2_9EUCA|nr:hypothetical protein Pmani_006857 [Petrolisthes manimaculis]
MVVKAVYEMSEARTLLFLTRGVVTMSEGQIRKRESYPEVILEKYHCTNTSLSPLPSWEHIIHQHISLSETMKGIQCCMAVLVVLALIFSTALGFGARRPNPYLQGIPTVHPHGHGYGSNVHHHGHGYGGYYNPYSLEVLGPHGFPVSIEYGYGGYRYGK